MTWLHGRPVKRAQRLIASIYGGEVNTQGKLRSWLDSCASLPPKLRLNVFEQLHPAIGQNGVSYLESLMPVPGVVEAQR